MKNIEIQSFHAITLDEAIKELEEFMPKVEKLLHFSHSEDSCNDEDYIDERASIVIIYIPAKAPI